MPAGTDLIFFDNSEDWQAIVNTTKSAVITGENSHIPIQGFDLGVTLNEEYVAVIAGTTKGKASWFFAGDISQVYNFSPGKGNPILGKIQPERTRLAINRLQLVETNRVSTDDFRLRYNPPAWFKDCTIKVYKYIGDKFNFVEDSLFDIGNALGIDPNHPDDEIPSAFAALRDDIGLSIAELKREIKSQDISIQLSTIISQLTEIKLKLNDCCGTGGITTSSPQGQMFFFS